MTNETHQEMLSLYRDQARRFVDESYGGLAVPRPYASEKGYSDDAYAAIAELGWLGVCVPEELGGLSGDLAAACVLMEAVGRGLVMEPVLPVLGLAARALAACGNTGRLEALTGGASLAVLLQAYQSSQPAIVGVSRGADGAVLLSGRVESVEAASAADEFLVAAKGEDGIVHLHALAASGEGVKIVSTRSFDGRLICDVTLDEVAAVRISDGSDVTERLRAIIDEAALMTCAEAVGAMERVIEITAEYLRTRKQFRVPLATFQSLQHRMVDMLLRFEEARAVVEAALDAHGSAGFAKAQALAKLVTARAARFVASEGIQLHGGIGMTDELNISRYFKRLLLCEHRFGDSDAFTKRYAAQ